MMRLIDADALFVNLDGMMAVSPTGYIHGDTVADMISDAPTVDALPVRHGKWIYGNDFHWYTASCNKCGYQRRTDIKADGWNQWRYCPNCGARMDAERREE